ncbi:hypothetical protein D9757_004902 [Collybiopsis confluens]|uniref:AMP-dependent synthetase/ligase domain-containing protein n=1 Tax=Collybiopsis confluens TaxID=2823264 RepID=A0A8H5MCN7_9AGAR|nr:hypothetical protein D9757_004902 [Collybiopsis confluens]
MSSPSLLYRPSPKTPQPAAFSIGSTQSIASRCTLTRTSTAGDHIVDPNAKPAENVPWFHSARLNWSENMLHVRSSRVAIIQATEPTPECPNPLLKQCTYAELYTLVGDLVSALLRYGVQPGDRIASYSSNCIENTAACLATIALGAVWVSSAADFGSEGTRFEQVQPKFIFTVDAVVYNAKVHNHITKIKTLLAGLEQAVTTKPKIVVVNTGLQGNDRVDWNDWIDWQDFVRQGQAAKLGRSEDGEINWHRGSFNDPLWILFSSGTTGRPKPIVHRSGGMLIQARKELAICADLKTEDVFFYYTTTGWMMWNFHVSGLASGCTLVLYGKSFLNAAVRLFVQSHTDGSPLRDPAYLWNLVDRLGITIFGTSAKYIDQLSASKRYRPHDLHSLESLRHIYSTGSPLAPQLFDWVYEHIKPDVLLGSITGGTDICSLFAGMNSMLPVFRGEIQCRMLGMAIEAYNSDGTANAPNVEGELVCVKPFPCMPVGFWPLPGFGTDEAVKAAHVRFQDAYFPKSDGIWYHGDHVLITQSREGNAGGVIMLGRSDGVLNPGGVRFGSAELYDVIDGHFADSIDDCIAIGQSIENGTDERVVLFIKLHKEQELSRSFEESIRSQIRQKRSPRHVPSKIIQVPDVPYTLNGKRIEVLVKKLINGAPLSSVNPATLLNPQCLKFYVDIGSKLRNECLDN